MGAVIRSEISKKNTYWIERHRYHELKHFCLQYNSWKKAIRSLDNFGLRSTSLIKIAEGSDVSDPTAKIAEAKLRYYERMRMIEQAAAEASPELGKYILEGVTEELSYEHLFARMDIPCCKTTYYRAYRRFFWLLSQARN